MKAVTVVLLAVLMCGLAVLDTTMEQGRPRTPGDSSAAVALAGEFRTVFANLLWLKLDIYHHEYIEHHGDWTKNEDALGLDRLITRLDPHFEEAYATGSVMLIGMGKPKEAVAYLEEGVTNNPNSMMLHDQMGTTLAIHMRDYNGAIYHLRRAYCIVKDDYEVRTKRGEKLTGHRQGHGTNAVDDDLWDMARLGRLVGSAERLAEAK